MPKFLTINRLLIIGAVLVLIFVLIAIRNGPMEEEVTTPAEEATDVEPVVEPEPEVEVEDEVEDEAETP
jgi:hypothetical protein